MQNFMKINKNTILDFVPVKHGRQNVVPSFSCLEPAEQSVQTVGKSDFINFVGRSIVCSPRYFPGMHLIHSNPREPDIISREPGAIIFLPREPGGQISH